MTKERAADFSPRPVSAVDEQSNISWRIVLWVLLLLSGVAFLVRGPMRYIKPTNWNDLAHYYAFSRTWLRGQNFANPDYFVAIWQDEIACHIES